jgi:hypothetical protein
LNFADSYRYDQFEGAVEEEAKKDLAKEGFSLPPIRFNRAASKSAVTRSEQPAPAPPGNVLGSCSLDGKASCGGSLDSIDNGNLLPILDPRFNLREASKHMILLEDHLFQPGRRCRDCCCKHLLTIEAFLEEAITLDKSGENYAVIIAILGDFKKFGKKLCQDVRTGTLSEEECVRLAQELRQIRKPICQQYATFM